MLPSQAKGWPLTPRTETRPLPFCLAPVVLFALAAGMVAVVTLSASECSLAVYYKEDSVLRIASVLVPRGRRALSHWVTHTLSLLVISLGATPALMLLDR